MKCRFAQTFPLAPLLFPCGMEGKDGRLAYSSSFFSHPPIPFSILEKEARTVPLCHLMAVKTSVMTIKYYFAEKTKLETKAQRHGRTHLITINSQLP